MTELKQTCAEIYIDILKNINHNTQFHFNHFFRGTKFSRFPNWLDNWLKMRKQLGLLMLFSAAIHVSIFGLGQVSYNLCQYFWVRLGQVRHNLCQNVCLLILLKQFKAHLLVLSSALQNNILALQNNIFRTYNFRKNKCFHEVKILKEIVLKNNIVNLISFSLQIGFHDDGCFEPEEPRGCLRRPPGDSG